MVISRIRWLGMEGILASLRLWSTTTSFHPDGKIWGFSGSDPFYCYCPPALAWHFPSPPDLPSLSSVAFQFYFIFKPYPLRLGSSVRVKVGMEVLYAPD